MQYHLNGFKPGNYQVRDEARVPATPPPLVDLPKKVDVLIVGCGPAGLALARQLSEFADIQTCIVEQKSGPLLFGQADGISCRTIEIMEAFNCSELLVKETYQLHQNAFWEPDAEHPEQIKRTHKVPDARLGLSEFTHGVVNQARLHDLLLDGMASSVTHLVPHYNRRLLELEVDANLTQDLNAYPITATFERNDASQSAKVEVVQARYVVGCDGARSAVRKNLAIELQGDSANKAWGVMDVLVVTDFPDIRVKSFIQSKENGAVMLVPREGGYLVRLYVELDLLDQGQRASTLNLGVEEIIAKAQLIMHPYQLEVKEVAWWSIYEVGQRVADRFDDRPLDQADNLIPRAFVAGDACHTHSPKGGWGLNTSLPDTFNLGWKLAAVLQGRADAKLLQTYATERRKVAQMLINADREMSALVATRPSAKQGAAASKTDTGDIEKFIARQNGFIAGTSIQYDPSYLCTGQEHQHLATGFNIGQRFHSAKAIRLADGRPVHLGHLNKADGRWRIFAFGDSQNPLNQGSALHELIQFLAQSAHSPIKRYTPAGADIDAVIELFTVLQQQTLSIEQMPELLWPAKGKYGLRDYEKLFRTDEHNDIFDQRGINRSQGCMVIVRPDQHIATVLPLTAHQELSAFFDRFMLA
ncbi:phenol 2-monooxygenase [Oceanospirillum multiglobuliferum]|uniref:Alkyl hydroperoxide reductase subunit F n=1 Tax=Oceanospirillum multiglobuliferum TaxID=64969 RepID=A0A1T4QLK3_9GAMM|nr:FAD-dependent monooxygenase [Oceanospirillum multiglobuliferum]OPX56422.1 phenol 2-monooxygenase [Oceanospirillum multiglobuliferum]SKA04341.1 phenol 2-monooxygenase [Oceanospirillum multiglobuliferum]